MNSSPESLDAVLESLDANADAAVSEHEVEKAIGALRKPDDQSNPEFKWSSKFLAFGFYEDYNWSDWVEGAWGTYFGPMMVFPNGDGTADISPSIKKVTADTLQYWEERAKNATHPVLKARYAGLVWDFSRSITSLSASVEMARILIDSSIQIAKKKLHVHSSAIFTKLKRAKVISLSIKDDARIVAVRDALVSYEDEVSEDGNLGTWGYSYDLILCDKKIPTDDNLRAKIIIDLENRLERVSDTSNPTTLLPWSAESAAERLATYYRSLGKNGDVKRVLVKYGLAFEKMAEPAASILAQSWLQGVYGRYKRFGLNTEAEALSVKIGAIGPKTSDDLSTISTEFSISREDFDKYVDGVLEGDLETALARYVSVNIPSKQKTVEHIQELARKAPLSFLVTKQLQDQRGRPVATVGPLNSDTDGNVIYYMSQNIQFAFVFTRRVMAELPLRHTVSAEILTAYLLKSPLFDEDKKAILEAGLAAYLEERPIESIHCLIPQIEAAVRGLVEWSGGAVLQANRTGGFHLKTFDTILRDESVAQVFGEDVQLYFRVLFTDPRGINLRNNVCHGITSTVFRMEIADRVIHALLLLAQVHARDTDDVSSDSKGI